MESSGLTAHITIPACVGESIALFTARWRSHRAEGVTVYFQDPRAEILTQRAGTSLFMREVSGRDEAESYQSREHFI